MDADSVNSKSLASDPETSETNRAKMTDEYSNGDENIDVKMEAVVDEVIDLEAGPAVPGPTSDAPDSTVSLEEGSGDERKKTRSGRAKRKAAINVRVLQMESDDSDSDYSPEDQYKDPSYELQDQVKVTPPPSRGRRGRPPKSTPIRESKAPKLQIRTDIGARSREIIAFICEWGLCEQQFLAIGDCWDHIFNIHLRSACLPETETLRSPLKCIWKGCSRVKRSSLPFSKFSHLTRHVTEAHPLRSRMTKQERPEVDNKAAERNRLYRERHGEEINKRRKEIRQRKKNSDQAHALSNVQNINEIEQIAHATSNDQPSSNSHVSKQERYYERHKEEINKRRRDSRLNKNISQTIPATPAERSRNYRERNRDKINERRKNSRLLQKDVQREHTECNINDIDAIEQIAKVTPNEII